MTEEEENDDVPFPEFQPNNATTTTMIDSSLSEQLQKFNQLNNVTIQYHRLNVNVVSQYINNNNNNNNNEEGEGGRMVDPCRVVVSGPDPFNQSARNLLEECGFETSTNLTVLSA